MAEPDGSSLPLQLTCHPGKSGNMLTFQYAVQNTGGVEIYVMDALPTVDPGGEPLANEAFAVVMLGEAGDAVLGKFMAPLPSDRRIAVPVSPLARRLPAGARYEARLEIPLPLAETSPYFADLTLRQYEVVDIKGIDFTIGYWVGGVNGLVAAPCRYAPEFMVVATRDTLKSARAVSLRFPTTGLQLFKRRDAFPRKPPAA
jgi:hypothetical protein